LLRLSARHIATATAAAFLLAFTVLPIVYMLWLSTTGAGLTHYSRLLAEPRQRELLANSLILAAGSAALATLLGAPLGFLLARANLTGKAVFRIALILPLVIPPYILALAWLYVSGPTGIVARLVGEGVVSGWTYSLAGAVLVLGVSLFPLSMLATEAAALRIEGRLEEAGLLVAPARRVFWRITLPLMSPAIAAAALAIFVLALSEFGVPGLLRVRVFTTEVFTAFAAFYDFGAATALAVPLLALALVAGVALKLVIGDRVLTTRRSLNPAPAIHLGRWRVPTMALLAMIFSLAVLLPLAVLAIETRSMVWLGVAASGSAAAIVNSIALAGAAATVIVSVAVMLGHATARASSVRRGFAEMALLVAFAVPGTVVGVGLIGLWNRQGLAGVVYTSPAIILIAYLARFTPIAILMLAAGARQLPRSSEEAAEIAGAGWGRTFTRIVLPQMRSALVAAWVVSFILAFGELGATVLVAPPGESTLPVRIYTLIANAPPGQVAALALMQAAVVLTVLTLLAFVRLWPRRTGAKQ
jgi:iron(III) transport system permease protein